MKFSVIITISSLILITLVSIGCNQPGIGITKNTPSTTIIENKIPFVFYWNNDEVDLTADVDLGTVYVDSTTYFIFSVKNTGNTALIFPNNKNIVDVSGDYFAIKKDLDTGIRLDATSDFVLTFNADTTGDYKAEITIQDDEKLLGGFSCVIHVTSDTTHDLNNQDYTDNEKNEDTTSDTIILSIPAPTVDVPDGIYNDTLLVNINAGTQARIVYSYTTGTNEVEAPTLLSGIMVDGPIELRKLEGKEITYTYKICAYYLLDTVWVGSEILTTTWTIDSVPPHKPYFSHASATYRGDIDVFLESSDNTTIYYTSDGSEPSPISGTFYTSAIHVSEDQVIKAIAIDEAGNMSSIASRDYFFDKEAREAFISLPSGRYHKDMTIDVIPDAYTEVYYTFTTNNEEPSIPTTNDNKFYSTIMLGGMEGEEVIYRYRFKAFTTARSATSRSASESSVISRTWIIDKTNPINNQSTELNKLYQAELELQKSGLETRGQEIIEYQSTLYQRMYLYESFVFDRITSLLFSETAKALRYPGEVLDFNFLKYGVINRIPMKEDYTVTMSIDVPSDNPVISNVKPSIGSFMEAKNTLINSIKIVPLRYSSRFKTIYNQEHLTAFLGTAFNGNYAIPDTPLVVGLSNSMISSSTNISTSFEMLLEIESVDYTLVAEPDNFWANYSGNADVLPCLLQAITYGKKIYLLVRASTDITQEEVRFAIGASLKVIGVGSGGEASTINGKTATQILSKLEINGFILGGDPKAINIIPTLDGLQSFWETSVENSQLSVPLGYVFTSPQGQILSFSTGAEFAQTNRLGETFVVQCAINVPWKASGMGYLNFEVLSLEPIKVTINAYTSGDWHADVGSNIIVGKDNADWQELTDLPGIYKLSKKYNIAADCHDGDVGDYVWGRVTIYVSAHFPNGVVQRVFSNDREVWDHHYHFNITESL